MNLICKITDDGFEEKYLELEKAITRLSARGIVIRDDGKIAIFNKSNKNEYKLPGGGIENNENLEEAFKREVLEETGCLVEIIENLGVAEECKMGFKQISNVFVAKVLKDTNKLNLTQKEKDEGAKLLWKTPQEALKLIKGCYEKLVASKYESIYATKSIVLRDTKILEYYIKREEEKF